MNTRPFRKAREVHATNTSFPSKVITGTKPVGTGASATEASVIELGTGGGGFVPCKALIKPYGTGDANDVFNLRVIGWRRAQNGQFFTWLPDILADLVCTLGAATGYAGGLVAATDLMVDTITITSEPTMTADVTPTGTLTIFSPANDLQAYAIVPLMGAELLELIFDMDTGDPTGGNALITFLEE